MKTLLGSIILMFCATALAQDNVIPFQGQLTDQSGQPLTAASPVTIVFRLYQVPVGGVAIWEEAQPNISVNAGRFSVLLGSRSPLPGYTNFNATLYLGLTVDDGDRATTDVEMRPRQALVPVISASYAKQAENADTLGGFEWSALFGANNPEGNILGSRIAPRTVTSNQIAPQSITASQIADVAVQSSHLGEAVVTAAKLAGNSVSSSNIVDGTITGDDIGGGQVVKSINGLRDSVTITAGNNIAISTAGNMIEINSSGWKVKATTNVNAASIVSFTAFAPNVIYRLDYMLRWNTATGRPFLRFNSDAANRYSWATFTSGRTGAGASGQDGINRLKLVQDYDNIKVGEGASGHFIFSTVPGSPTAVSGHGGAAYRRHNDSLFDVNMVGGQYTGLALSSVQLHSDAGSFTGQITLSYLDLTTLDP